MSFLDGFDILRQSRPGFDLTTKQAALWNAMLSDLPPAALVQGALKLGQESDYPFTVAAWRQRALAFVAQAEAPGHDAAWEELRRNRAIEMSLLYEQRQEVLKARRAKIVWSSEAARRAAEYVDWRNENWNAEDVNTLRAQHRGAYLGIVEKQGRIDAANDVRSITPTVLRALDGGGQGLLGGGP